MRVEVVAGPVGPVAEGKVPGVVVDPAAAPVLAAAAGVVVDIVEMVSVAEEQSATVGFMNKDWRVCPLLLVKL